MKKNGSRIRHSLKTKTTILIITIVLALGVASVLIYNIGIRDMIIRRYEIEAQGLSATLAGIINSQQLENHIDRLWPIYQAAEDKVTSDAWGTPEFDAYIERFSGLEETEDFQGLLKTMRDMQAVNDVDCVYVSRVDAEREQIIYLIDAAEEDACPPGTIDPVYEVNREVLTNPERGFPPYMTNTEPYGALISAGAPVHNAKGDVIAYAFVDISMSAILQKLQNYLMIAIGIMAVIAVLSCVIGISGVQRTVIRPLLQLTEASERYFREEGDLDSSFSQLQIHTGDEIEVLADSMARMEKSVNDHITRLLETTNALTAAQNRADEMDRQANVDVLTKVRNKRGFEAAMEVIRERMAREPFPLAVMMADMNNLKEINDAYGHDKGDVALQTCCGLICSVFKHSPVFRIGGDEFVILLEGEDFQNRDALLRSFEKETLRKNSAPGAAPWEHVDIAMGLAIHDPEKDAQLEDTLQRADEIMYAKKRRYKAEKSGKN